MSLPTLLLMLAHGAHGETLSFPQPRDPSAPAKPRRVAIVFGLDGRIGSSETISSAERSARQLAQALGASGFHVIAAMTGEDASAEQVRRWLMVAQGMNLGVDDTLLVAAITHGGSCMSEKSVVEQQLRVVETRTGAGGCWEDALTDLELLAALRASGAGRRMLYVDACNTPLRSMGVGSRSMPAVRPDEEVVLRSAAVGGAAFASQDYTLFTQAFIQALTAEDTDLDGDGAISAQEAYSATERRVFVMSNGQQTPAQSTSASGPTNRIILVGEPAAAQRAVLGGLPAGLWRLGVNEYDFNVPNEIPVLGGDTLEGFDRVGTAIRIRGIPTSPGRHNASTWFAGRRRGLPSLAVTAGVAALRVPDASLLRAVLDDGGPSGPALGLGLHQVVLPWLALNAGLLYQQDAPALSVSAVPQLHVRAWTGGLGPAAGLLRLRLEPSDDGGESAAHLAGLAGAHAELRRGVLPAVALVLAGDAALVLGGATDHEILTPGADLFPVPRFSVQIGAIWDAGVASPSWSAR